MMENVGSIGAGVSSEVEIERILADPKSKEYKDLRDRAAYMHITGTHPSHLRTFFTRALTAISSMTNTPASFDGFSGSLKLDEKIAERLKLDEHPMVQQVRKHVKDGWKIRVSRGPNARKPFTKIFMFRGKEQATVQIDGSIKDHWD